jgi:hypothetical protein
VELSSQEIIDEFFLWFLVDITSLVFENDIIIPPSFDEKTIGGSGD